MKKTEPTKPRTVPAAATYDATNQQWELGKRNAKGKPIGKWKYWWRTTGHLCCVSLFENGGRQETYTRLHPDGTYSQKGVEIDGQPVPGGVIYYQKSKRPTTELAISGPEYKRVFRVEHTYFRKGVSLWKNFDAKGRRIEMDGTSFSLLALKAYAKNFGALGVPKILAELVEFQNHAGSERFAEGFALSVDDTGLIKGFCDADGKPLVSRAKEKKFLSAFMPVASATGTGSVYFIWNDGTREVAKMPIVVFGDEGGYHVVADNVNELLSIVGADVEPMIDHDAVSFYKTPDHEPRDYSEAFRIWLKAHGIKPASRPDAIVKKAQKRHARRFERWVATFV